jgi:uncharacterized protein YeaO (DUF488 family)
MIIQIERVYETDKTSSATRFLVDRLWPRGIKTGGIEMTAWLKDVAPSNELRKWFNHDPAKWKTFQSRYFAELDEKPESLVPLFEACKKGPVVLLYGARDKEHNQAVALKKYLEAHKGKTARRQPD